MYAKRFENTDSFMRYIIAGSLNENFNWYKEDRLLSQKSDNKSSTSSYDEAEELFRFGDKNNLQKLQDTATMLKSHKGETSRQIMYSDVQGFMPNVANYVNGLPYNMFNVRQQKYVGGTKIVNIVFNPTVDWGWGVDKIVEVGIKILDCITSLERQGYRVNLYVLTASTKGSEIIASAVRIKRSDDRINLMKLAYPLVNPSYFRRHFARFIETSDVKTDFSGTYGNPQLNKEQVDKVMKSLNLKADYYLTSYEVHRNGISLKKYLD